VYLGKEVKLWKYNFAIFIEESVRSVEKRILMFREESFVFA